MASKDWVGKKAPDFTLQNQSGKDFKLSDALKKGPVLLAFYPGDFTPVCTKQLCDYRDNWERISGLGLQVVGVSGDGASQHEKFKEEHQFQFELLTDPKHGVAKQLGCTSPWIFGNVSRAIVLVDANGTIQYHQVEPTPVTHRKAGELVEIIQKLKSEQKL